MGLLCVCISCQRSVSSTLAVILSSTDQDPSLEIKYRPKKNKEKETEPEMEEISGDESSSPPPKIDRRRVSQVREIVFQRSLRLKSQRNTLSFSFYCSLHTSDTKIFPLTWNQ